MFKGPFDYSIVKKALENQLVEINLINIRDFGIGKHKIVDDTPYGGGIGMVMRADVLSKAVQFAKKNYSPQTAHNTLDANDTPVTAAFDPDTLTKVVLLSASGKPYDQKKAGQFSQLGHLILICGHYEGVDERIKKYIDEEISVGDFVTTGGEIPAMLITDSVTRLLTGVLKTGVTDDESFSLSSTEGEIYLEYPHYTKPAIFENMSVPEVLLSGNHKKIQEWRKNQAFLKTQTTRPDLLKKL